MTYYVSIGNSDDKLGQVDWSVFQGQLLRVIQISANEIHGVWYSPPTAGFQNMCVCFEAFDRDKIGNIRAELRVLARLYDQDTIALAKAQTEFIKGE